MATATSRVTRTWIAGRRRRKIYVWCNRLAARSDSFPGRRRHKQLWPGPRPSARRRGGQAGRPACAGVTGARPARYCQWPLWPYYQGRFPARRISRPNFPTGLVEARPRDSARLDPGRPRFPADAQGRASAPFVSRPRRWHRASECLCRRHRSRRARALRREAASVERQLSCREEPRLRCGYAGDAKSTCKWDDSELTVRRGVWNLSQYSRLVWSEF